MKSKAESKVWRGGDGVSRGWGVWVTVYQDSSGPCQGRGLALGRQHGRPGQEAGTGRTRLPSSLRQQGPIPTAGVPLPQLPFPGHSALTALPLAPPASSAHTPRPRQRAPNRICL